MLFKIMRADPHEIVPDCRNTWVTRFYTEIKLTINRIEKAYNWQLKTPDSDYLKCTTDNQKDFFGSCKRVRPCCRESTHDNGRFSLDRIGIKICGHWRRLPGNKPNRCPNENAPRDLKESIKREYPNSNAFDWWRAIEAELNALRKIRDSPRKKLENMCGIGVSSCISNDIGCACVNDVMCGGNLVCRSGKCSENHWWSRRCKPCRTRNECSIGLSCLSGKCKESPVDHCIF